MFERIEIVQGDITQQGVDAIVNAANTTLLGGGGVDGAIHKAAGPELLEECKKLNGCPTGQARITNAYLLPCRWVIHTVGPVWSGGKKGERELLRNCYTSSLELARDHGVESISFPSISTGAYRYPFEEACEIALRTTAEALKDDHSIRKVNMVCFSSEAFGRYGDIYASLQKELNQS